MGGLIYQGRHKSKVVGAYGDGLVYQGSHTYFDAFHKSEVVGAYGDGLVYQGSHTYFDAFHGSEVVGAYGDGLIYEGEHTYLDAFHKSEVVGGYGDSLIYQGSHTYFDAFHGSEVVGGYDDDDEGAAAAGLLLLIAGAGSSHGYTSPSEDEVSSTSSTSSSGSSDSDFGESGGSSSDGGDSGESSSSSGGGGGSTGSGCCGCVAILFGLMVLGAIVDGLGRHQPPSPNSSPTPTMSPQNSPVDTTLQSPPLSPIPSVSGVVLAKYRARISDRDHFTTKGQDLRKVTGIKVADILLQDRLNFNCYNLIDSEDEPDGLYARLGHDAFCRSYENKPIMISPAHFAERVIFSRTPLVEVSLCINSITVTIIDQGNPLPEYQPPVSAPAPSRPPSTTFTSPTSPGRSPFVAPPPRPTNESPNATWTRRNGFNGPLASVDNQNRISMRGNNFLFTRKVFSKLHLGVDRFGGPDPLPSGLRQYSYTVRFQGNVVERSNTIVVVEVTSVDYPEKSPKTLTIEKVSGDRRFLGAKWTFRIENGNLVDATDSASVFVRAP